MLVTKIHLFIVFLRFIQAELTKRNNEYKKHSRLFRNGDDSSGAWYDTQIETYKKQMAEAPDTLPELENYDDPYCEYVGTNGDHKYSFSFSRTTDDDADAGVYMSFFPYTN